MEKYPARQLKDKDGKYYPVTHESAVVDENGNPISSKMGSLADLDNKVRSDSFVGAINKVASTSLSEAEKAAQSATEAATYITSLRQAIADLPDGQAVSEMVAEHTVQIDTLGQKSKELSKIIDGSGENEEIIPATYIDQYFNTSGKTIGSKGTPSRSNSEGTHAYRIGVHQGEVYNIYGKSKSAANGLYMLVDSETICIDIVADSTSNYRITPKRLEITTDGELFVNLATYDESTDKVTKVTVVKEGGLVGEVEKMKSEVKKTKEEIEQDIKDLEDEITEVEIETYTSENIGLFPNKYWNGTNKNEGTISASISDASTTRMDRAKITIPKGKSFTLYNYVFSPSAAAFVFLLHRNSDGMILIKSKEECYPTPYVSDVLEEDCTLYINVSNGGDEKEDQRPNLKLEIKKMVSLKGAIDDHSKRIKSLEDGNTSKSWLKNKTLVMLGDSQVGDSGAMDENILTRISLKDAFVCGFSGCYMSQRTKDAYGAFSMHKIADAIVSNDYTSMEAALSEISSTYATKYRASINNLKSVAWGDGSDIIMTVQFGGNDWKDSKNIGTISDGVNTVMGATKYVIETLLTAFPKLSIIFVGHPYCVSSKDDSGAIITDSDTTPNAVGKYRCDYQDAVGDVAKEYHLPFFDMYRRSGRNRFNTLEFASDGKHWHTDYGREIISGIYCKILQSF